jgi:hypothetical protein
MTLPFLFGTLGRLPSLDFDFPNKTTLSCC